MTPRRALPLALAAMALLAAASCKPGTSAPGTAATPDSGTMRTYAHAVAQAGENGLPPGYACMWEDVTPDGKVAKYPAKDGQVITVPNGTPHPYKAQCVNGALTAQPGSGEMPS